MASGSGSSVAGGIVVVLIVAGLYVVFSSVPTRTDEMDRPVLYAKGEGFYPGQVLAPLDDQKRRELLRRMRFQGY